MLDLCNPRPALLTAALALVCLPAVNAQAISCVANAAVPPVVRAEGLTELAGDFVLICVGGTPTPAGAPVPLANVQVFLNTFITSRLTADPWSEALLIIDEPEPSAQRYCSQEAGCPITGTGTGVDYSAANGAAPNIYQGRQVSPNSISWLGVPLDPPGATRPRIIRIVNIRFNANFLGVSSTLIPTQVNMLIAVTGAISPLIAAPQKTVAYIQTGLSVSIRQTVAGYPQCIPFNGPAATSTTQSLTDGLGTVIRFSEGFPTSFRTRGNQPHVDGNTSPPPVSQNIPGALFYRETAFYNSAPNIVAGSAHGLEIAGLADHGTRLIARFSNVPQGVTLYASLYPVVTCPDCGPGGLPAITSVYNAASVTSNMARLIATNGGEGPFNPVPATNNSSFNSGALTAPIALLNGAGLAVWEVLTTDPLAVQSYEFGIGVAYLPNAPNLGTATVVGDLAPLSLIGTTHASAPISRFALTGTTRSAFNIGPCSVILNPSSDTVPAAGATGKTVAVTTYSPATPWTVASNVPWITITSGIAGVGSGTVVYNVAPNDSIHARTGSISVDAWRLTLSQPGMSAIYSLSKTTDAVPAAAGSATVLLSVTPSDAPWTANTNGSAWLSVHPYNGAGTSTITYTFTANPEVYARIGSIIVGGRTLTITQAASSSSAVILSAVSDQVPMSGVRDRSVIVSAPANLPWAAVSLAPWIFVTAGASATGNAEVVYNVAPNPGTASRFASINIAGQAFTVTQSGPTTTLSGPIAGTGVSNLFTVQFTHPQGFDKLDVVNILVNQYLDGDRACYLAYSRPLQVLYLVDDLGPASGLSMGLPLGGSGSVSNSQCTVHSAASSAIGAGNTLTLNLDIQFSPAFTGGKVIYLAARDALGGNSGWFTQGVWTVPGAALAYPRPVSVTPASGTANDPIMTFVYDDQTQVNNLQTVWALVNTDIDGRQACYAAYHLPTNRLYLFPDNGDGTRAASIELSGLNEISNSQCTISAYGSGIIKAGQRLTLVLNVYFEPGFSGPRGIWTAVQTLANQVSPWVPLASWQLP